MSATVEEVLELADVSKFLEENGVTSTTGMCHNACCWLAVQIKKANLSDYNIHLAIGTFWQKDHSWLIVEDPDNGNETIVDMTVNQFVDRPVPHVGPMTDEYEVFDSCSLIDDSKIRQFVENMG